MRPLTKVQAARRLSIRHKLRIPRVAVRAIVARHFGARRAEGKRSASLSLNAACKIAGLMVPLTLRQVNDVALTESSQFAVRFCQPLCPVAGFGGSYTRPTVSDSAMTAFMTPRTRT